MNITPELPTKPRGRGCLIKIILAFGIILLSAAINVGMTGSGERTNPLITIVMGCAILALWAWKPGQSDTSKEIDVKPLDKKNEDRDL